MEKSEFETWFATQQETVNRLDKEKTAIATELRLAKEQGQVAAKQLEEEGLNPNTASEQLDKLAQDLKTKMTECDQILTKIDSDYAKLTNPSE